MAQTRVGIRNGALFNNNSTLWNNLLAYYTGDNTPNDALGNYNGTLVNGATYGTGKINQGFSFDGINDYIDLGNNFDNDGTQAMTWSCWINSNTTSGNRNIIQKIVGDGTGTFGYKIFLYGTWFAFYLGTSIGTSLYVYKDQIIPPSTFKHVVITYNGNSNVSGIKMYVDGVEQAFTVFSNNLTSSITNTDSTQIGGDGGFFKGLIDEVGIWDRELSSEEVTELYNSGSGKQYPN